MIRVDGLVTCRKCKQNYIREGNDSCPVCKKEVGSDAARLYRRGEPVTGIGGKASDVRRLTTEGLAVHKRGVGEGLQRRKRVQDSIGGGMGAGGTRELPCKGYSGGTSPPPISFCLEGRFG